MSLSILGVVARENAAARAVEFDHLQDGETREGLPLEMYRALPDSPNAPDYRTADEIEQHEVEKAVESFTAADGTEVPKGSLAEVGDALAIANPTRFGRSSIGRRRPRTTT